VTAMKLKVAGIVPESIVDGPGIRLVLFVQGCSHRCPGCHNPETHDPAGGTLWSAADLLRRIKAARGIDGVTFSGGEPFEQPRPLAYLAEKVKGLGLNLVLYSGYTFEQLLAMGDREPAVSRLLEAGDLLVDGPYVAGERDLSLPYRGSKNQRLLDLPASLRLGAPQPWEARRRL
jgi:anaerobic ribonucleoside-triphosphate reductase activating protein